MIKMKIWYQAFNQVLCAFICDKFILYMSYIILLDIFLSFLNIRNWGYCYNVIIKLKLQKWWQKLKTASNKTALCIKCQLIVTVIKVALLFNYICDKWCNYLYVLVKYITNILYHLVNTILYECLSQINKLKINQFYR